MASAFSLNRATLIGNLGSDPELKTIPSGTPVCNFNVATTQSYKDQGGNWQDKTEWHRIVLWARLAERAAQYLRKGSKVYIEGSIETRSYEKDGIKRYTTEIRADNFINMEKTDGQGSYGGGAPAAQSYGGGAYQGGGQAPQQAPQQQAPAQAPPQDEFDDDVPF